MPSRTTKKVDEKIMKFQPTQVHLIVSAKHDLISYLKN